MWRGFKVQNVWRVVWSGMHDVFVIDKISSHPNLWVWTNERSSIDLYFYQFKKVQKLI